jgi:hypothetical protein
MRVKSKRIVSVGTEVDDRAVANERAPGREGRVQGARRESGGADVISQDVGGLQELAAKL